MLILLSLAGLSLFSCENQPAEKKPEQSSVVKVSAPAAPVLDQFGLPVDSMDVKKYSIQRNESLYEILRKQDFSPQQIYRVTQKGKGVFDARDLKPGQKYFLYTSADSSRVERLVWQPSPLNYVVFDWEDSLRVFRGQKQVKTRIHEASGVIQSSLYETLQDEQASPLLAYKLSDIFAWEIDFFRLREGDRFKVIYEQQYVDGKAYGLGRVLAARFEHRGEEYNAYLFQNGEKTGYYDAEGKSVQKALLKAPLRYSYISSGYSNNRYHPVLHRRMAHHGVDYAAPTGTPVHSVGDGSVVTAAYVGPNGNMVKVRHNGTYTTTYIHLSRFAKGIRRGVHVKQGQTIGYVGTTGRSTGPHLDYRIFKHGHPVNPMTIKLPPSKSVKDSYADSFSDVRSKLDRMLNGISYKETIL